ncbi:MAG: ATP-binding protein [Alphaproteobacteria bacterium]|nr:ATP-binding protein [Alphaproteobacteria bacterium]
MSNPAPILTARSLRLAAPASGVGSETKADPGFGRAANHHQDNGADERFRDLAENLPGAVFRYLLHPDGRDEIEYMSSGCEQIWETSAECIRNDPTQLWQLVVPDDIEAMRASVVKSAETMDNWLHIYRIVTPSGRLKWLEGRGTPHRQTNGTIVWNSVILDVTDREKAQAALERQTAGIAALQDHIAQAARTGALGEFSSSLAHEINQPLAAVLNYLYTARQKLGPLDDAVEAGALLDKARSQAERCASIVQRMRALFATGAIERRVEEIDGLVQECIGVALSGRRKGLRIATDLSKAPTTVYVDRIQLQQVLINLLRNARDAIATAPNGAISLRVQAAEAGVWFFVDDNGPGIPVALIDGLFEPYISTKAGGTGVGLSVSASIIRAHGGVIQAENLETGGARFSIYLPSAT